MNPYLSILLDFAKAFAVGGAICVVAQLVINFTKLTAGRILVFFMLAGVVLEALGLYHYAVEFAGAGATVPISGFGYLLARGAIRGATDGLIRRSDGHPLRCRRGRDRGDPLRLPLRAHLQAEE